MEGEAQGDLLGSEASQTETTSTPWYSEENREVVERCGWKDPNDVIKGYRGLEKDYSGRVKMPSPESSAEEIRAFYQKTGCPENPEGYEVTGIPETVEQFRDEATEGVMKQIAYDQGVSKQAFESIIKGYYEKMATDMVKSKEAGEAALKQEWSDKYDENLKIADRFFDTCSAEFCALVKQTGLASNPVFIKEFLNKGKQTMADSLIKGEASGDEKEDGYVPQYKTSPEMYVTGEDEESVKARAYFTARGHVY